jgi:signal transduction histidine kinase
MSSLFSEQTIRQTDLTMQTGAPLETTLFELFSEPLLVISSDGFIEKVNSQFETVFGWQSSVIVGTSIYSLVEKSFQEGLEAFLQSTVAGSQEPQYILLLRSSFNREFRVGVSAYRLDATSPLKLLVRFNKRNLSTSTLRPLQNSYVDQQRLADTLKSNASSDGLAKDFDQVISSLLDRLDTVIPYDIVDVMLIADDTAYIVYSRGGISTQRQEFAAELTFPVEDFPIFNMMREKPRPVLIPDVSNSPLWNKQTNYRLDNYISGIHAYLGAPLRVEGTVIGFINLNSYVPDTFTTTHVALLELFVNQASIAIGQAQVNLQNRTQLTEMEIYLRNIMTMYELGNKLTSTFNLDEIYASLYDGVISRNMPSKEVHIVLIGEDFDVFQYGFIVLNGEVQPKSVVEQEPVPPETAAIYHQLILDTTPQWKDDYFYIPMLTPKRVVGIISIGRLSEEDMELVDLIPLMLGVNMAAIAIENARLYQTFQAQHDEISSLYHATTVLFNSQDIEHLAQQIVDTITYGLNQQDCSFMLVDDTQDNLIHIADNSKVSFEKIDVIPINGPGLTALSARTGRTYYVPDVTQNADYLQSDARVRSELVIPLMTERQLFGVLDLQSDRIDGISEKDRHILAAFVGRVSIVIDNLLLTEELRAYANRLEDIVDQRTQELKDALVAERKLSETKSRFVMTVSHQFRTPLAIIQSAKDMLEKYSDRMPENQRRHRFETIDKAVKDIVSILDDTITVNTMSEGAIGFNPTTVDLNQLTETIIEDYKAREPVTHQIAYVSDSKEAVTIVDIEMWRKAVNELLTNARKFSSAQSEIRCTFRSTAHQIEFEVQDQGIGIPADDLDRVFGIYDRGANVDNIAGAGLGLAIIKQLMERHRGEIQLQSKLDTGTIAKLVLPRYIGEER